MKLVYLLIIVQKKILFKIESCDWGLKTVNSWSTKTWCIYDDLSVDYKIRNGEDKIISYYHSIKDEDLKLIIKNIELAKSDNREVQACDGEAWSFTQYENESIVWERKLGYIYGLKSLEIVCNILKDLVRSDSDIFIDEKEERDMGEIDKKDKYDIDVEDNIPRFVYGIPDAMRKKWEAEGKEKKEKNELDKYNIDPYDNVPREVYGIPDVMRDREVYDIEPEDNVQQRLYGVPNANNKED